MSENKAPSYAPFRKNITNERILNLRAKNNSDEYSTFQVQFFNNQVAITIWVNMPNEETKRLNITVPLSTYFVFLNMIKLVADSKEEVTYKLEVTNPFDKEKEPGTLYVGKSGFVWISYIEEGKPKIRFPFEVDNSFKLLHKSGEVFSIEEASSLLAKSYVSLSTEVLSTLAATEYVDPTKRSNDNKSNNSFKKNYSNNKGYNNYNKGNYNNYNKNKSNYSNSNNNYSSNKQEEDDFVF